MVIVKHVTPHLHEFMVKFVIFHVNQVNFDQEKYTVALIQHKRRSKNRLGGEMIVALPLLYTLRVVCEYSNLLTWAPKKIRTAYALFAYTCSVKHVLDEQNMSKATIT